MASFQARTCSGDEFTRNDSRLSLTTDARLERNFGKSDCHPYRARVSDTSALSYVDDAVGLRQCLPEQRVLMMATASEIRSTNGLCKRWQMAVERHPEVISSDNDEEGLARVAM